MIAQASPAGFAREPDMGDRAAREPDPFRSSALVSLLRLHWFIHLRWVMVGAALAALVVERLLTLDHPRPALLYLAVLATAACNLVWMVVSWRLSHQTRDASGDHWTTRAARRFASAQVTVDLFLLTLIIAASGGVENPFVVFYLFHMAISALLLTTGQAIGQGLWAVALYCGMGWGQYFGWFGTHYEFLATLPCPHAYADLAFVSAMCVVQAVAVAGTLYFTIRIARRLDMQEGQLRDALDELAASRARLAELQERRARFMATAAHQLKSPFAAIQTMASLIRDDYVTGDAVRKTVEAITRRCAEAIEAVGQLLTLARVREADPRRHRTGGANIRAVVEEIARRRGSEARGKGLNFDVRLDAPADLRAPIDPRDLADCVDNLVENAIKYTPGPGLVSLSVETTGDTVAIEVADTGIGIAEVDLGDAHSRDSRSPIFEPYRRGNVALEAGISGSGLGLSIVREVIEQTGGTIAVRSQVGSGSKFTITWPRPVAGASAGTAADTNALVQT